MRRDFNMYCDGHTYYRGATSGWPEVGKEPESTRGSYWQSNEMRSLVPDTAENRAALDEIARGFEALMQCLSDLLSPEQAEKTLANVKSIGLLPAANLTK
jgi:hypothetical protein